MTMAAATVFVSYSHHDRDAVEHLRTFLKPLERDGLLACWVDTQIAPGRDWHSEILAAIAQAQVAVLLISQAFLASDFIAQEEIPRLLARAHDDGLLLLPVFISPSTVADQTFTFVDASGREHRDRLTRPQGVGTPEKPLADRTWSERDRLYVRLSQQLRERAQGVAATPVLPWPSTVHARLTPAPEPAHAYTLTIQLERQGDRLHTAYHLPSGVCHTEERPWAQVQAALTPLEAWLHSTEPRTPVPDEASHVLFDVLFGTETTWEPIFRSLFHAPAPAPRPNPIRAGVQVRLCTHDTRLLGLPWRLTAWQQYRLVEKSWTFVTTPVLSPSTHDTTTAPCNVLLVALHSDLNSRHDPLHLQAMHDVLQQVWPTGQAPGYVRTVQTLQALGNAIRGMQPHLLYVYGQSTQRNGEVHLPCAEGGSISLRQLAALLRPTPPALLYLNVAGLGGAEAVLPALGTMASLLLWRGLSGWQPEATSLAVAWLRHWLQERVDPVQALHDVSTRSPSVEAATLLAHGQYRTWDTQGLAHTAFQDGLPHWRLNRDA